MATEEPEEGSVTPQAGEEPGQGQEGQQNDPTPEEGGNGGQQPAPADTKLPDDHPIVKALAKANAKSATQAAELQELRAQSAKATKLEEELAARPTPEAMTTLQTRYDRLEAFLLASGGPLSKALDSRTFTRDLFETDKDIDTLVKDWHKANPTATAAALGSGSGDQTPAKIDPNKLLRIAAGKE